MAAVLRAPLVSPGRRTLAPTPLLTVLAVGQGAGASLVAGLPVTLVGPRGLALQAEAGAAAAPAWPLSRAASAPA